MGRHERKLLGAKRNLHRSFVLLLPLLMIPPPLARAGIEEIGSLLPQACSAEPNEQLRARRRVKLLVLDHYRAQTPEAMRLVPGPVVIRDRVVAMEGGFYLSLAEVTEAQYARYLRERGDGDGARLRLATPDGGRVAATMVSLDDARTYAAARGCRLPTAEELARAARGEARYRYPWGDRFEACRLNSREAGVGGPRIPGTFADGASPLGFLDLFGNVAEWTESTNGKDGERQRYLVVGGSYRNRLRQADFVTYRLRADECQVDVGFRLARDLPPLPVPASRERGS